MLYREENLAAAEELQQHFLSCINDTDLTAERLNSLLEEILSLYIAPEASIALQAYRCILAAWQHLLSVDANDERDPFFSFFFTAYEYEEGNAALLYYCIVLNFARALISCDHLTNIHVREFKTSLSAQLTCMKSRVLPPDIMSENAENIASGIARVSAGLPDDEVLGLYYLANLFRQTASVIESLSLRPNNAASSHRLMRSSTTREVANPRNRSNISPQE